MFSGQSRPYCGWVTTINLLRRNLRSSRLSKDLSQQALAEHADLAYKYYQEIEAGRVSAIKLPTIEKLAKCLDVEPWMLLHPDIIPEVKGKKVRAEKIDR